MREDYSADGTAWEYFPHDHARSRAYRWSEDGLGGLSDRSQHCCLAFAFYNGADPILKERIFGLTANEGNHGEDAKELWWYEDSTPTHSYLRWRYLYPIAAYPYEDLVEQNRARSREEPEYELEDTGVLDDGSYFDILAEYAKATPDDLCITLSVTNCSKRAAPLQVLPTLWFRNVWSWGIDDPRSMRPLLDRSGDHTIAVHHPVLGERQLIGSGAPEVLFCDNETNTARVFGIAPTTSYPKDGIADHVLLDRPTVNPAERGTKAALWYDLVIDPGATEVIELRYAPAGAAALSCGVAAGRDLIAERRREADEFYAPLLKEMDAELANVTRQAFGSALWSKQLYHYNVARWLDGDPASPPPPLARRAGRNARWRHLDNFDVISMPDTWEYPWFASWDLGFHAIVLAHVDPQFAKDQLLLVCREWYQHPSGQLPAYEWAFGDVNPPVQARAALAVFAIDGSSDLDFLERIFHKLLINFTWWVNAKGSDDPNLFGGGFLGLDNIAPFDRSSLSAAEGRLEQADGTAWMAIYCLDMLEIALILARHRAAYEDVATKFLEHFAYIATALSTQALFDEDDGLYYDVLVRPDGSRQEIRVHCVAGLLPLCATLELDDELLEALPRFNARLQWFVANHPEYAEVLGGVEPDRRRLCSAVSPARLERLVSIMLDEAEFLSPYGIRSVSAYHRDHPFSISIDGQVASVDYEPGWSTSALFGGNSNWRGPVWFPVNYLLIEALDRHARHFGPALTVECPARSGHHVTLDEAAQVLRDRLLSLFVLDPSGRRPMAGTSRLAGEPSLIDRITFPEYFHGDTGAGLGASHQTGWTALVADLAITTAPRRGQP